MAVKKKPVKKAPVKTASPKSVKAAPKKAAPKKAEVKKAPAKKVTKAEAGASRGQGRPAGAKTYIPDWIEPTCIRPFARKNATDPKPGVASVLFRANEDGAIPLEKLAELVKSKDARLAKLLK